MKYQVIIIGGGPAGYTAAETAGKAGSKADHRAVIPNVLPCGNHRSFINVSPIS